MLMRCKPDITRRLQALPAPQKSVTWCNFLRMVTEVADAPIGSDSSNYRAWLRNNLNRYFSEQELRTICFDLGWDYEDFPAEGKPGKAREIVAHTERVEASPNSSTSAANCVPMHRGRICSMYQCNHRRQDRSLSDIGW